MLNYKIPKRRYRHFIVEHVLYKCACNNGPI